MILLSRNAHQIKYIYSSTSHLGKQVLGYLKGAKKDVEAIDISKENIGDSKWIEVAENLEIPLGELFQSSNSDLSKTGDTDDFDTKHWLKLIGEHPELLNRPILIHGETVKLISNRSQILHFFGVDSAGLEKTMAHESPTISSTTENENFI